MAGVTNLYRHYGSDGQLLYVGISFDAITRLRQHVGGSRWNSLIAKVEIEAFNTRDEAILAERTAIQSEMPVYNIKHKSSARPAKSTKREPRGFSLADVDEHSEEWLTAVQVSMLAGGTRTHPARGEIPPSAQRIAYMADGSIRGNVYFWRKSDVLAWVNSDRGRRKRAEDCRISDRSGMAARKPRPPLKKHVSGLNRQLFTDEEWTAINPQ